MRHIFIKATLIIILTSISSCHEKSPLYNKEESVTTVSEFYEENKSIAPASQTVHIPKNVKLIKTGKVRYQVENVMKSTKEIQKTIQQMGGYISNLQFRNNRYSLENKFTVKIPRAYFDRVLDTINNSVLFIDYENINTQDVTEEYTDLQTRLKTKQEVKARYESVLRKQAKTVKDILETEEKLGEIQEEIEAAQGRLKYLQNRVSYSTIVIELYEEVDYQEEPVSYEKSFWIQSKEGFVQGWELISLIVVGIINIWPVVLILCGTIFWFRRKRSKKKSGE
jgi:predicted small lipoprotein YifL